MQRAKRGEEGSHISLLLAMVKRESTVLFLCISYCPLLEAFLCGITLHSDCSTFSTFASFYALNFDIIQISIIQQYFPLEWHV